MTFIVGIVFIPLEQKTNLTCIRKYADIKIFDVIMPSEDTEIITIYSVSKIW